MARLKARSFPPASTGKVTVMNKILVVLALVGAFALAPAALAQENAGAERSAGEPPRPYGSREQGAALLARPLGAGLVVRVVPRHRADRHCAVNPWPASGGRFDQRRGPDHGGHDSATFRSEACWIGRP